MTPLIPVFRTHVPIEARERAAVAMARGWIGYGPECRELEARFVQGRGGWALATSACTSALYLAALLARRGEAPEVVVPSITFISTAMAFHHAGYRVRVAAVDPQTLMLTERSVAPLVNEHTTAVVAVHLYGQRCRELPALRTLCDARGAMLVEDCAHRVDLLDGEAPVGDLLCYSFNAVKEIPCGEGGMLWARDEGIEALARASSNAGLGLDTMQRAASSRHADYQFTRQSGLKLRCNDLGASLANASFPHLDAWRARRRAQFALYDAALAPLAPALRPLARSGDDSCLMYVVQVHRELRDRLRDALARERIATSVHYPSLARHPLFRADAGEEVAPDLDEGLITLPTYLEMTPAEQATVTDALTRALQATAMPAAPQGVPA